MSGKASAMASSAPTQNILSVPERPVAVVRITSDVPAENPRWAQPWFLVHVPADDEFVAETIEMLFGRQADGEPHTWVICK